MSQNPLADSMAPPISFCHLSLPSSLLITFASVRKDPLGDRRAMALVPKGLDALDRTASLLGRGLNSNCELEIAAEMRHFSA